MGALGLDEEVRKALTFKPAREETRTVNVGERVGNHVFVGRRKADNAPIFFKFDEGELSGPPTAERFKDRPSIISAAKLSAAELKRERKRARRLGTERSGVAA